MKNHLRNARFKAISWNNKHFCSFTTVYCYKWNSQIKSYFLLLHFFCAEATFGIIFNSTIHFYPLWSIYYTYTNTPEQQLMYVCAIYLFYTPKMCVALILFGFVCLLFAAEVLAPARQLLFFSPLQINVWVFVCVWLAAGNLMNFK